MIFHRINTASVAIYGQVKSNAYLSADRGWFLAALEVVLLLFVLFFFFFVCFWREREREREMGLGNYES